MGTANTVGTAPVEGPQGVWDACVGFAELVFDDHDRVPWQRERRLASYAVWRMSVPAGEALSRTLLGLRLYAVAYDVSVTTGRPLTRAAPAGVRLAGLVSRLRPYHELFVGLGAVSPGAERSHWVNVLRLLSYHGPGGDLALARLDAGVRTTVERLVERYRDPGLAPRDLAGAEGCGAGG